MIRAPKPNLRPIPQDLAPDLLLDDAAAHWNASKNILYRQRVLDRYTTLLLFLQANGFLHRVWLSSGQTAPPTIVLRRNDFTEDGFLFVWRYLHKWYQHLDRGKPIDDRFLTACLEQFRKSK